MILVVILAAISPSAACAQQVLEQLEGALDRVATALERSFARSLPLPAASAGVSYSFDPATGNFRRDPATFGQVYLERADPLGARRLNVSFTYQYVELEDLDGHPADDLRNPAPIPIPDLLAAFEIPNLSLEARVHQFLFALTYGLSENLEASIAVPVVYSDLLVRAPVAAAGLTPDGQLLFEEDEVDDSQQVVGAGDVLLRAKYRFIESREVHLAASLLLRFPSGDEEDLQGIGFFEVTPSVLASTRIFEPASWARLQGHFNAGVGFDTEDVGASEARWGVGLDWGLTDDVTAAIAFLGRNEFSRVAPAGAFTFPRCQSDLITCAIDPSVRVGTQQLFGLSGDRPDYYDLSVGGRGALWRDTLFAFVSVAIPLNDGFVRTAPIPLVGVEATF